MLKSGTDKLSDFKLSVGVSVGLEENKWRGVELPQVAMHRNCHIFSCVLCFTYNS